jgi:sirohydrochlorin ferrochelatase
MQSAYLLVFHGSRDPRPKASVEMLAELVSQSQAQAATAHELTASPVAVQTRLKPMVGTASLELSPVPLHKQLKEFGDRALACGYNSVQVVPLFLLPGVHVMEDIPAEVALAQQALGQDVKIDLRPYLGTHAGLKDLLATQLFATKAEAWIILAHGSSRAGSKQPVEAMARALSTGVVVAAYWAAAPRLESRVKELVSAGYRQIGIMPYFLFAGGITDAIAQSVDRLQGQFPSEELQLAEPLGASAELADLIVDLMEK